LFQHVHTSSCTSKVKGCGLYLLASYWKLITLFARLCANGIQSSQDYIASIAASRLATCRIAIQPSIRRILGFAEYFCKCDSLTSLAGGFFFGQLHLNIKVVTESPRIWQAHMTSTRATRSPSLASVKVHDNKNMFSSRYPRLRNIISTQSSVHTVLYTHVIFSGISL